jgi:hypothetical protein
MEFSFIYIIQCGEQDGTEIKVMLRPAVSRPVCLVVRHPSEANDQVFIPVSLRTF